MKLSHSKLNQILTCPMSYYLNHIQGIEPRIKKSALNIGSAVHWGIEHNTTDLTEFFKEEGTFKQQDNYTKDWLLAESMIYGYLKHKDELFKQILTDPVTGEDLQLLEETHELFLSANLKSYAYKEDHEFIGIIDLLLLTNKGWIIIDYKTSSQTPEWEKYLDQLYRYIFEIKQNFPDIPVLKIAIINLRKATIRQKKNENEDQFLQRLKFEYDLNDEDYINYHEYLQEDIDEKLLNNYISNLSKQADMAQLIDSNKMWYINFQNANGIYGKSEYYDIFYQTPGAEVLYTIKDYIYDNESGSFVDRRDCVAIDMKVIDHNNVLNKYEIFKKELLATSCDSKESFFEDLSKNYIVDTNLLNIYWKTYVKEKEVRKDARQ